MEPRVDSSPCHVDAAKLLTTFPLEKNCWGFQNYRELQRLECVRFLDSSTRSKHLLKQRAPKTRHVLTDAVLEARKGKVQVLKPNLKP